MLWCALKHAPLLVKFPTTLARTYMMHYTCSKPHWPLGLISEMNFLIAVLIDKASSFLWNFKAITQRQHPASLKEITSKKEENSKDGATTIHVFVLCCSLKTRFGYLDCIQKTCIAKFSITLAWLILTCCNQLSDLIKIHIVFQGSIKN